MSKILSSNAQQVGESRYFMEGENWDKCCLRVASEIASIEADKSYKDKFYEMISNMDFIPAGRILRNAGRVKGSLFNCFCLPIEDNIESIGQFIKESLIIWSEGGGVGSNWSYLRPKGDLILKKGGLSSGMVSFLEAADAVAKTIETGGQRRAAGLACVSVSHPEVLDFIDAKTEQGKISHFNISVIINDEFLTAVSSDSPWTFRFKQKEYNTVPARFIWDKIISNMIKYAEPGIINWSNFSKNNSYYYDPIVSPNPCQPGYAPLLDIDRLKRIDDKGENWSSWSSGFKEVIRLSCNNGLEIDCTPEHKIMLNDGNFLEAKDCLDKSLKWGLGSRTVNKYDNNEVLRGFLFGDSCLSGLQYGVDVKINDSKEPEISRLLFDNRFHKQPCGDYYINRGDLPFDTEFLRLPSFNRKFPDDIFYGDSIKSASFLKGLFSANGSCNKRAGQISLKSTNYGVIKKVQLLLASFGIPSWICSNKPQKIEWSNGFYTSKKSYNLQIAPRNGKIFKEKIGFLQYDRQKNIRDLTKNYLGKLVVKKIESLGTMEVFDYNMKLPPHYNWCQGGILKNCMEATLSPYECCNLGSLVLPNFITGNINTNWNKLDKTIKLAVRFLDNIIDINKYTLKEIDEKAHNSRRIGIGIMGLAEYLFSKELRYGSPKSILEIEKLIRFIRESVYTASVELSMERGSFPKFDSVNYGNASFIRKLPAKLRMDIKNHGVRNVTLMALAPTGTISLLPEVSSGIEPIPAKAYRRRDKVGERVYIHHKFKEMLSNNSNVPEWFVDAGDLKPEEHLEVQSIFQKYTDGSISKTINMPKESTCNQLDKLLLEYIHDLKGVAVYVDGSRENQVLNRMDKDETLKYLQTEKTHSEELIEEDLMCPIEGCSKE